MTPEEREGWLSAFPHGVRKAIEEEIDDATKALREENERLKFLWTESAEGSARQRERAEQVESANRPLVEALREYHKARLHHDNEK